MSILCLLFIACSPKNYELRYIEPNGISYLDNQGIAWYDHQKDHEHQVQIGLAEAEDLNPALERGKEQLPASACRIERKWIDKISANINPGPISYQAPIVWTTLLRNTTNHNFILIGFDQAKNSVIQVNGQIFQYNASSLDKYYEYAYAVCEEKRMALRLKKRRQQKAV